MGTPLLFLFLFFDDALLVGILKQNEWARKEFFLLAVSYPRFSGEASSLRITWAFGEDLNKKASRASSLWMVRRAYDRGRDMSVCARSDLTCLSTCKNRGVSTAIVMFTLSVSIISLYQSYSRMSKAIALLGHKQEQEHCDHDIHQWHTQRQGQPGAALDLRFAEEEVGQRTKHRDQVDHGQPANARATF